VKALWILLRVVVRVRVQVAGCWTRLD